MLQVTSGVLLLMLLQCDLNTSPQPLIKKNQTEASVIVGAEDLEAYLPLLKDKNVAGVFNQSSLLGSGHLVDALMKRGVDLQFVFALEHGFRGTADAGAKIKDDVDLKSGLPIKSLYGKKKKPTSKDLEGIDVLLFDIQDVGVRFYTYISTLHYIMEACAEHNVRLIVLDRPNPNSHYVDGPMLEDDYKSFVGMHNVPVVYGMTIGEYAKMIKGESWISEASNCDLTVIPCRNYTHQTPYDLPVKPSPNLPNYRSILLYPSICFFEGTSVSVGRGTDNQFQVIGHPDLSALEYSFVPEPKVGAKTPKHNGVTCYGEDLSNLDAMSLYAQEGLNINYLIAYHSLVDDKGSTFFTRPSFFDKLAGTSKLRMQIKEGMSSHQIRASWQSGLSSFKDIRSKYLIYSET